LVGSQGIIYVALDTNLTYRWSGSTYIEISPSAVVSVNTKTGIVTLDKTDIGLSNVDNTSDANKPISNATQTALNAKEDSANKSIDGTLASNSDTLFPTQKAVKTYVDGKESGLQAQLDASVYYHELHVNFDYTGGGSTGSPYKPFTTIQAAVNAAQLQNVGGNTAIIIHLKKDLNIVENVVVNNAVANLYILPATTANIDACPIKITGSLTITGSQTNRVRVKNIQFQPTSGYALIIDDTNGRHMFQNCQFTNGSVAGLAGTGVNLINTYKNFIEFVDCTIEGTLNIAGTPSAGTLISMYRSRLAYANVILNTPNVYLAMYDTYGVNGITHSSGVMAITGLWGFSQTGFFNSTAALGLTNFISLANMSFQKLDLSFVSFNKTGTCSYQLINVHRNETSDVITGSRVVYGPTATDASYKMGVLGNWSPAVSNVAGALDQLAANKANVSHTQALSTITQSGATTGQVATWNGTIWTPTTITTGVSWGGITGTLSNQTDLQNALNAKQNTITGAATTITSADLTASRALVSNASGKVAVSPVTNTELGYVSGVTSSIQTQLNGKFNNPTGTAADYIAGNGTIIPFPTVAASDRLVTTVYNSTGVTVPAGSVIYLNGPHGNLPNLVLAQADSEVHSFLTYGITQTSIGNMSSGIAVQEGRLENLNTNISGWNEGDILFLSPSVAGGITNVKPTAPNHMVIIGTLVRKHPAQGVIQVKIQNGYQLNELHNVALSSPPSNNQVLKYESATSLWKNKYIGSANDIEESSFTLSNNQSLESNITGFSFSTASVRSFEAEVSVAIDAGSDYYETFKLYGVNKGGSFDYYLSSFGDNSGITLSVTSAGQVQYTSNNYAGFVNAVAKFKAKTLNF
jgi:hypothetical protein